MGALTEGQIVTQAKKGQGETNQRLDAILREQQRTNQLLELLAGVAPGAPIAVGDQVLAAANAGAVRHRR